MQLAHIHLEFWRMKKTRPRWSYGIQGMGHIPYIGENTIHKCVNAHGNLDVVKSKDLDSVLRSVRRDISGTTWLGIVANNPRDSRNLWAGRILSRWMKSCYAKKRS